MKKNKLPEFFKKQVNILKNFYQKVWSYKTDIETHTVETHIYRLRKKILNTFNDSKFIMSKKNGYQINKNKINS